MQIPVWKLWATTGAVGAAIVMVLLIHSRAASNTPGPHTRQVHHSGKPAPDFTLQDAEGTSVKLSDYRGKVVLLNFWATWCGPCGLEIPWFEEFEQRYKSKGLEVVGISMDEDGWSAIKPYIAMHKMNYRILLGNDSVAQLYGGVDSLPTTFLIDRDGSFASAPHIGLVGKNEYQNEIESLLDVAPTNAANRAVSGGPAVLLTGSAK